MCKFVFRTNDLRLFVFSPLVNTISHGSTLNLPELGLLNATCSLQAQVSEMSTSLHRKIDALQQCDRHLGCGDSSTGLALNQIKHQLNDLTRSMESCTSEMHEVHSIPGIVVSMSKYSR